MKSRLLATALLLISALAAPLPAHASARQYSLPQWAATSTMYEVNVRQYSPEGTFQAVTNSLPRLKKLGVGILWLMPIHPISQVKRKGVLGSPYSVADYKGINPEFGSAADLHTLITEAHQLGLKVILDWVPNHSGWDNPWLANKSWYYTGLNGEVISPNSDWTDVAWLNYENTEMRSAMLDAMKYWVNEFDIDGFRADVAGGVPVDFWEAASSELQKIKPLFMLAEDQENLQLLDSAFQVNYNWNLLNDLNLIGSDRAGVIGFVPNYNHRLKRYPDGSIPLNFITNHDENSWNGSEFKRMGPAVKALAALTFTFPGMPLIYSGQEVGNSRELKFFEKDEIPNISVENEMTAFYTKLTALKRKNPALWNTAPRTMREIDQKSIPVLSFARSLGKNRVIYLFNASNKTQKVLLKVGNLAGKYSNFSSSKSVTLKSEFATVLKPWQFEIYSTAGN